ncbi:hypothetical protein NECAME_12320 [Necator americanus]|uniref:Uncharacterized protein n=1 Tax=Necator americanus TaxID=51031 RepID=W2T0U4_NECAM|nr:hypothetical protein NECAME_12320 [Necator americanus]ETN75518.1 hypothetical protein NECAME_12320 [Necator americanus]
MRCDISHTQTNGPQILDQPVPTDGAYSEFIHLASCLYHLQLCSFSSPLMLRRGRWPWCATARRPPVVVVGRRPPPCQTPSRSPRDPPLCELLYALPAVSLLSTAEA